MGFLSAMFGAGGNQKVPRYTQLSVQTSAQGLPVPICWGASRISPNLIWQGDFSSEKVKSKGGSGGGKGSAYLYYVACILGLSEGPLVDLHLLFPSLYPGVHSYIGKVWVNQAQLIPLSKLNLTPMQGTAGQAPWTGPPADEQLAYSSLAYVYSPKYSLGYSPTLPEHSFEVFGAFTGSYTRLGQGFYSTANPNANIQGGAVYTSSDAAFAGIQFTFIGTWGTAGSETYVFSPPAPAGSHGGGTLTLVAGAGPASVPYTSSANAEVPILDANPADIVYDFLTNPQYSIGLDPSLIDAASLAVYKTYCAAQGLFIAPALTDQGQMSQAIDRWASLTNTLIFWSEGKLKFVPLGDSAITNTQLVPNVSYVPDLTIRYDLTYDDFIDTGKQGGSGNPAPPVAVTRIDPADAPNHVKVEIRDRANGYNAAPVEWQDQGLVDQFGQIDSPVTEAHEICDMLTANIVVQLVGQRLAYVRNTYAFTLGAEFSLLEPGDILTLTDPHLGIFRQPVRIRTIDEDDKLQLSVVAEEFPGSLGTAFVAGIQPSSGGSGGSQQYADPGDVNPPAVFEPGSGLTGGVAQLWMAISGGPNLGGAIATISFDGGVTFEPLGYITVPCAQGISTADYPNYGGANPDTTDTLHLDLTESSGALDTGISHADADNFRTLALLTQNNWTVNGDGSVQIPDNGELIDYGSVTQGASQYLFYLTYCYRGLWGTTIADHPSGSYFSDIELNAEIPPLNAVLIYNIPRQYIGTTIRLKFLAYNTYGNELQDASDVVEYAYTITGRGYGGGSGGVPTQPTGLVATGIPGAIALSWNAKPSSDNVTNYQVLRATASGGPYAQIWNGNATSFTDFSATIGATCWYEITATNAAGISVPSASASAAALPLQSGSSRSITVSTSSATLLSTDNYVGITNTSGGAITVNLPSSPGTYQDIRLADEGVNAGTSNWTIKNGAGATVGTVVTNSGGISLHWTGSIWQQTY